MNIYAEFILFYKKTKDKLTQLWSMCKHHPRFSLPPQNSSEGEVCQDILLQKNNNTLIKLIIKMI